MPELSAPRVFKAARFWSSNVIGAALAGGLGGILMLIVMGIIVWGNPAPSNIIFAIGLVLVLLGSVLCFTFGNLIAAYPYCVALEQGKGLELRAPLKKLYIPVQDLNDVRRSMFPQPGYIVRLNRRNGLLKSFLIPSYFGNQAESLVDAIREEISNTKSR